MQQSGLSSSLCVLPEYTPSCSSTCPTVMLATFRAYSVPCPLRLSHPEFSSLGHRNRFVHRTVMTYRIVSFLRDVIFMIFWWSKFHSPSWNHELPRCMHALSFWILLDSSLSLTDSRSFLKRLFVPIVQGIPAPQASPTFSRVFLMVSLYSPSSGSVK